MREMVMIYLVVGLLVAIRHYYDVLIDFRVYRVKPPSELVMLFTSFLVGLAWPIYLAVEAFHSYTHK